MCAKQRQGGYEFWTGRALGDLRDGDALRGECRPDRASARLAAAGEFVFNLDVAKKPDGRMRVTVLPTLEVCNALPVGAYARTPF
jgi:hypothetical protein